MSHQYPYTCGTCRNPATPAMIMEVIEKTFQSKQFAIECPWECCRGLWPLEDCRDAANISDKEYVRMVKLLEDNATYESENEPSTDYKSAANKADIEMKELHADTTTNESATNDSATNNSATNNSATNDSTDSDDDTCDTSNNTKKQNKGINRNKKKKQTHKKNQKNGNKSSVEMGKGLIGLENLVNTCYMNSALQCLLKCPGFAEEFFNDKVKLPRKWKGAAIDTNKIAYIWSEFVKQIYTKKGGSTAPKAIKYALNRLNPIIGNGKQQDAFVVILTLLRGLDEDLCSNKTTNREVDVGPSEEKKDDISLKEKEAEKLWKLYTKGKDGSTIVRRYFNGIECETSTCADCHYQSILFRSFRHIELPLCNKNIKINIKIYIPEIPEFKSISLDLKMAYDNRADGLIHNVLEQKIIKNQLQRQGIKTDDVKVQFGYIHPRNNNNHSIDVNKWIKFMEINDNCAKIKNYSEIFAVLFHRHHNQFPFIPTFNLIKDRYGEWVQNDIDLLTFTIRPSSGKILMHKINNWRYKEYNAPVTYYDNTLVTDESVKITGKGCLLRIWTHERYPNKSPSNVKINLDEKEIDAIQSACEASQPSSIEYIIGYLNDFIQAPSKVINFIGILPGYNSDSHRENKESEITKKLKAKSARIKLQQQIDSEKLAHKWLRDRINHDMDNYKKHDINYTKPIMLDNVDECLKAHEMKTTSDGILMECKHCDDCPAVASKKIDIIKPPKILTLHINREQTKFSGNDPSRKRDNLIKYPIKGLEFSSSKYDLFAVVEHSGYGTDYGHYVCYVKSLRDDNWYIMNDLSTSRIKDIKDVVTRDASVLLYHKTSNMEDLD